MSAPTSVNFRRLAAAAEGNAADVLLRHAIERDVRSGQDRAVLALHLSQMPAPGPRPYHRRIAKAMLDDAGRDHAGQVLARGNADVVLICDPAGAAQIRDVLTRLFRTDAPLNDRLLSLWRLPDESGAVEAYLSRTAAPVAAAAEPMAAPGAIGAMAALVGTGRLTDFIRRQIAVQIVPGGIKPLFRELSFSIEAMNARLHASEDPEADPYLFRHLANRLDTRMIDLLAQELSRPGTPPPAPALHLNLSVSAILSPGFLRLREAAERSGASLGIEVALVDACADSLAFGAARMVLRAHGCRTVIDGIDHQALLMTQPEGLETDLVKLDWTPRMLDVPSRERRQIADAVRRIGPRRLVLHRVESGAALAWGLDHGIGQFQGRHMDALLAAGRLASCPQAAECTLRQCIDRAAATGAAGRAGCRNTARLDSAEMTQARSV